MAGPTVAGQPAADRLMAAVLNEERRHPDLGLLTREHVAVVLHALADHTALEAARVHRRDPGSPWPTSLSIGRWLQDVADQLEQVSP